MKLENYIFAAVSKEPTDIFELEKWADHDEVLKGFWDKKHQPFYNDDWSADIPNKKEDEQRYQEIKLHNENGSSSSSLTHICCPHCMKFAPCYDFLTPKQSWEKIMKEAATKAMKEWINKYVRYYNYNIVAKEACMQHVPYDRFVSDEKGAILTCPHCGERLPMHVNNGYVKEDGIEFKALCRDETWYEKNIFNTFYKVFDCNKEGERNGKITLSEITYHLFPNVRGRLHIKKSNRRFVFNANTGQAYMMRTIEIPGNKPLYNEPKVRNMTYSDYCCTLIPLDAAKELVHAIAREKGLKPEVADEFMEAKRFHESGYMRLITISLFNRFASFGVDFLWDIYHINRCRDSLPTKTKRWIKSLEDAEQFGKTIKSNKISGKKNIKLMAQNPMRIMYERLLKEIGFKDINNIMNLMENAPDVMLEMFFYCVSRVTPRDIIFGGDFYNVQLFMQTAMDVIGETSLCKKLIGYQCKNREEYRGVSYTIKDTASQFEMCVGDIEINKALFKGNLTEIHDRLSRIYRSLKKETWVIPYHEEEMTNCGYGDYVFTLAKDSIEMSIVGGKMNICVGSYDRSAKNKSCNIVFMYDKSGTPQASIELKPICEDENGKVLFRCVQFKDYCNHNVTNPDKAEAAKAFLCENGIDMDCYDITDEIKYATYDKGAFYKIGDRSEYLMFKKEEERKAKKLGKSLVIDGVKINNVPEEQPEEQFGNFDDFMDIPFQ